MRKIFNHPILGTLPYTVLNNPSVEVIKTALLKKSKQLKYFKFGSLLLFMLGMTNIFFFSTPVRGEIRPPWPMDLIIEYLTTFSLPWLAFMFHRWQKQCSMTDEEILNAIDS
jgi:hypothetical protein